MSFADFLTAPDRDEHALVVMAPRQILEAFTLTAAQTNTYEVAQATHVGTAIVGGLYRRVVGVRENGTNLTEQTSIATVEANASSWWWDEANATLYVHSSTGSDPDTFTTYQAIVEFYFSTKPIVLNRTDGDDDTGIYHHPWVLSGLPQLTERDDDALFGAKVTTGTRLALVNGSGWWDTILAHDGDYRWKHAPVCFLLGGSYRNGATVLLRSEYDEMVTMLVEDVTATEESAAFELKPLAARLTEQIPVTPYFASTYPNLGEGVSGKKKWIGYGRTIMPPDLTDTSSHGVYTLADAAFQTLDAVASVWAVKKDTGVRTLLTLTTHYTVDLTACTVTIVTATYKWEDYTIEVDVTGKPDSGSSYLKTFGEIARDILETFVGVRTADIDTAAFSAADTDATQEISLWVKKERSIASILSTAQDGFPALERSVQGLVYQTPAGQWTADIWSPSYDPALLPTLRKSQFSVFQPEPKLESVFATVQVYYNQNHATGAWSVEEVTNAAAEYEHDTTRTLSVYTFLRDSSDAQTLAGRLQAMYGGLSLDVEFEEVGVTLAAKRVRDRVMVDYDPAPVAAGLMDGAPFELVRLDRLLEPTLTVRGRLQNLRGIGQFVGTWMDSSAPVYASATEQERAASGFWSDSNGDVVPGDVSTRNISVWW